LANLLDNARRHGGSAIEITLLDSLQRVEIRIEDRGPGIPEAERARVFEPYVRLEPSRAKHTGGTGLGLAIARAIARAHGGDVTLENREGGGLSVLLTLPRTVHV
jgi:signal transduction histidine kinase